MDFTRYQGPLAMALRRLFERGPADPWPKDVDEAVRKGDAPPVCLNCLRPQSEHYWFCKDCGFPGGEYMTVMPYLHVFPLGEMFRRGVLGAPERKPGAAIGYVVVSFCEYSIFGPIYWYWMYRKAAGRPICVEKRPRFDEEERGREIPAPPPDSSAPPGTADL